MVEMLCSKTVPVPFDPQERERYLPVLHQTAHECSPVFLQLSPYRKESYRFQTAPVPSLYALRLPVPKTQEFLPFEFKRNIFHQIACKVCFTSMIVSPPDTTVLPYILSNSRPTIMLISSFSFVSFVSFCADELTVPQHRHRIAYPERLFHTVGNINNRNILFFKSLNLCKQLIPLRD